MKRAWLMVGISLIAGVVFMGCNKKSSSSGGGPAPQAAPEPLSYNGTWVGTNSQGEGFSFNISNNSLTMFHSTYTLMGTFCSYEGSTRIAGLSEKVENNKFSFETSGVKSQYKITGSFESSTKASGTLVLKDDDCYGNISLTWAATRISGGTSPTTSKYSTPQIDRVIINRLKW